MDLTHRFTVPAGLGQTWAAFNDVEQVAGCFPGATVTEVDGDEFKGSCKVRLGPIALVYNGTGRFVDKDEAAGRFVLEAKGKDKRGNGTAGATVTARLSSAGESATDVEVVTDLAITGKPAQFGRGVIQDVSDKLLGQFVACLEQTLGTQPADVPPAGAPPAGAPPAEPPRDDVPPGPSREEPRKADALDLGATALPILLRAYWKPLAGLVGFLLLLRLLARRR